MQSTALIPKSRSSLTSGQVVSNLKNGQLLQLHSPSGGAVIICHPHFAEILGHGSAVGGVFDIDACFVIPIGNVCFIPPESYEERQTAYSIRQKWVRKIQAITLSHTSPLRRAWSILELLVKTCGLNGMDQLSDELIALLVGVLPRSVATVRPTFRQRCLEVLHQRANIA